jgi:hypothetical protein
MNDHPFRWERALYVIAGAHFLFLGLWLSQTAFGGPDQTDWYFIRLAGDRFLDGSWDEIYSNADIGFFWRFPPYGLYPASVLALLPATSAYWLKAAVEAGATIGALWLLWRTFPRIRNPLLVALLVLASAPFANTVNIGQNSGILLFLIALGLWIHETRSPIVGFGTWGLLVLKPNIGIGFGLLALSRRRWREVLAVATGAALVVITALPLASLWDDFVQATFRAEEIRQQYSTGRQITALGFLDGAFPGSSINGALWVATTAALLVAAYRVWTSHVPFARKAGAVVLLVIAANPYMSFYDSLLLAVPAIAWWATPGSYGDRRITLWIGWGIAIAWLDQHLASSYLNVLSSNGVAVPSEPRFSLVGVVAAAWLVLEAIDASPDRRRQPASATGGKAD